MKRIPPLNFPKGLAAALYLGLGFAGAVVVVDSFHSDREEAFQRKIERLEIRAAQNKVHEEFCCKAAALEAQSVMPASSTDPFRTALQVKPMTIPNPEAPGASYLELYNHSVIKIQSPHSLSEGRVIVEPNPNANGILEWDEESQKLDPAGSCELVVQGQSIKFIRTHQGLSALIKEPDKTTVMTFDSSGTMTYGMQLENDVLADLILKP